MRRFVAVAVVLVALVAASGCEPAMKITARPDFRDGACGEVVHVEGKVTPASATKKVVLQRTSGGKWIDAKGWGDYAPVGDETARTSNVNQSTGAYSIPYLIQWEGSTRHLRVRSAGGAVSPGFYVSSEGIDGFC